MQKTIRNIIVTLCLTALAACSIENDIPYPLVDGSIQAIEVEGQCDENGVSGSQVSIDKDKRTVKIYVDDTADLNKLRITRLSVTNNAEVMVDSTLCNNYKKFPSYGFESLSELPLSADTRMNLSKETLFVLHTYQDYVWKITVERVVKREIVLENQIGDAVIDENVRKVVIYVSKNQPLNKIKVSAFSLGGPHGSVTPNPTKSETYDFSNPVELFVQCGWEEISYKWTVYVYQKEEEAGTAEIFSRTSNATLSGKIQSGKQVAVEYKKQGESSWTTLSSSAIEVSGTNYVATVGNLSPSTTYSCRVNVGGQKGNEQTFTTAPATPLTDAGFDNWYKKDKLWNPWAENGTSYWDTGNRGAITISESNSVPTDDTCNGTGQAAYLESKWLVMKFAAGNIFTGSYVKTTGTNGVLSFGREFSAFPTKLRVNYKYTSTTIDRIGDDQWNDLKGRPDSCFIWIALTDWDEPREIRTRPSERQLFEINDPHVIAYAELIKGSNVASWTREDLVLKYRYTNRKPKYIVVVATSSKYGDYFTGGVGSKLWLDNFELLYD